MDLFSEWLNCVGSELVFWFIKLELKWDNGWDRWTDSWEAKLDTKHRCAFFALVCIDRTYVTALYEYKKKQEKSLFCILKQDYVTFADQQPWFNAKLLFSNSVAFS